MKPKIPNRNADLVRYVRKRRCLQIFGFVLWSAALVSGAFTYNAAHQTYPPEDRILGWKLAVWIAVSLVSGFLIFRVYKILFVRTVVGRITHSDLSHNYTHSADPGVTDSVSYDFRLHTHLTLKTADGKRKRLSFEQKDGFYLYYYEGNRICRFAGLPYPLCDSDNAVRPKRRHAEGTDGPFDDLSGDFLCVACGRFNKDLHAPCGKCGHSLIAPREVFGNADASSWTEDETK